MTHTITQDRSAAVSIRSEYLPMQSCPIATKVILLGAGGVATVSHWNGKDSFWKGWHPLPKKPRRAAQ